MGRYINCAIATKIKIKTRLNLKENKEQILKRVGLSFDLNYYEINEKANELCLFLKEDMFNKEHKALLLELVQIPDFKNDIFNNIQSIKEKSFITRSEKNQKLFDYLNNNFDLRLRKEYKESYNYKTKKKTIHKDDYKYFMDGAEYFQEETDLILQNYFFHTYMCYNENFNDKINEDNIDIKISYIPFYFDLSKTSSEYITPTTRILNHLLRGTLKNNLKNTLVFVLTE